MRMLLLAMLVLLTPWFARAQAQAHQVVIVWTDALNPTGTTYNVYRANGACPANPPTLAALGAFTVQNTSPVTVKTYTDTAVNSAAVYCYFVTALNGTSQSSPSNTTMATIPGLYAPAVTVTVSQ